MYMYPPLSYVYNILTLKVVFIPFFFSMFNVSTQKLSMSHYNNCHKTRVIIYNNIQFDVSCYMQYDQTIYERFT